MLEARKFMEQKKNLPQPDGGGFYVQIMCKKV